MMNNIETTQAINPPVYDTVFNMVKKAAPKLKGRQLNGDTLLDDIGMDSLEKLSVAMDLEELYTLFIPDDDIEAFLTINDVTAYLETAIIEKANTKEALTEDKEKEND